MKTILAAFFVVLALTEASPWYYKYRKWYLLSDISVLHLILIIKKALDFFSIYKIFKLNTL